MTRTLVLKLLRDLRWPMLVVALLLCAFQGLWAKITQRITGELVPLLMGMAAAQKIAPIDVEKFIFEGPGKLMRTFMGGETIHIENAMDILSIGYVHPLVQTIFCIWAIGRGSGAIAGEIDRGTMELLLAQPIRRYKVILAHLTVEMIAIPLFCICLLAGTWLGVRLIGPIGINQDVLNMLPFKVDLDPAKLQVYPGAFGPGLWNAAGLLFAIGGYTMWLSAAGRFRGRVMGAAVLITLLQFLINVLGQLWDAVEFLRPFTVFYYYQPQQIILQHRWTVDLASVWGLSQPLRVPVLAVLFGVGVVGYAMALWTFCRRDLPAPL